MTKDNLENELSAKEEILENNKNKCKNKDKKVEEVTRRRSSRHKSNNGSNLNDRKEATFSRKCNKETSPKNIETLNKKNNENKEKENNDTSEELSEKTNNIAENIEKNNEVSNEPNIEIINSQQNGEMKELETKETSEISEPIEQSKENKRIIQPIEKSKDTTENIQPIDKSKETTENIQPIDQSKETTDIIQPIDKSKETTAIIQPIEQSKETTAIIQPTDQSKETTEIIQPIDKSKETTEIIQPIDQSKETTEIIQPIDKSKETTEIIQPIDKSKEATAIIQPIDQSKETTEIIQPIDKSKETTEIIQPIDKSKEATEIIKPIEELQCSADVKEEPKKFLKLVPIEKLISPNTKYVSLSQIKTTFAYNNIFKDIIVLDSDDSDTPLATSFKSSSIPLKGTIIISNKEREQQFANERNRSVILKKNDNKTKRSSRKICVSSDSDVSYEESRPAIEKLSQRKPSRTTSRRAKTDTMEKIKQALAIESNDFSSTEFEEEDEINENTQINSTKSRLKTHVLSSSDESDEPLARTKLKNGNKINKITNKNKIDDNTENNEKYKEKRIVVRLKRSSCLTADTNESPEESFEITRSSKNGCSQNKNTNNNEMSTSTNYSKKFRIRLKRLSKYQIQKQSTLTKSKDIKLNSAGRNKRIRIDSTSDSTNGVESSRDSFCVSHQEPVMNCDDQASQAKEDNINISNNENNKNESTIQNDTVDEEDEQSKIKTKNKSKENSTSTVYHETVAEEINAKSKLLNELKNSKEILKENNSKDKIDKNKEKLSIATENKTQKNSFNVNSKFSNDLNKIIEGTENKSSSEEEEKSESREKSIEEKETEASIRINAISDISDKHDNDQSQITNETSIEMVNDIERTDTQNSFNKVINNLQKNKSSKHIQKKSKKKKISASSTEDENIDEDAKQNQNHTGSDSSRSPQHNTENNSEEKQGKINNLEDIEDNDNSITREENIIDPENEDINSNNKNRTDVSDGGGGNSSDEIIKFKKKRIKKNKMSSSSTSSSSDSQNDSETEQNEQTQPTGSTSSSSSSSSETEDEKIIRKRKMIKRSGGKKKETSASEENPEEKFDDSEDSKGKKKKKTTKRKRIKADSDSSDYDEDGTKKFKRKNIRKIIKTQSLNFGTKRAAEEEKERRRRIEERQRLYNSIYEKPEATAINELVLDFEKETKKALLKVDAGLLKQLKPHQASGVKFMWDACFETLKEAAEGVGSGCILAHCMGLGKTLQIITLTHTLITNSDRTGVERVLVITPLSTLTNWAREFEQWLKFCKDRNIEVYDMSKFKDKNTRTFKLNEWHEEGGVCIIGYDMYRILSNEKTKGLRKKQRETLQKVLVDPGPDLVVCDEGHLLKNEKTSLSQAVTKMRTRRRIVLTGTPLQNNLKEYYCMIQFIKPNLLGTYKEYLNRFVNPITNGQYTDSTERDIRLMKHRSHILHKLLEACIQRRDYSVLAPYLPPKHEYVVYITLSEIQKTIYEYYMTKQRSAYMESTGKGTRLFYDFQNLRRILTHPMCLRVNSDIVIKKRILKDASDDEASLKDFIVDNTESESSASSSDDSFNSDKSVEFVQTKRFKTRAAKKNGGVSDSDIEEVPPEPKEDPSEWWCQMVPKEEINNLNNSSKLVLLMSILCRCEEIGDKLLLFSQSLQSLDVIEEFLSKIDKKTQGEEIEGNVNNFQGSWKTGIDYFRLDGSCSVESRELMCKRFNDITNLRARLFLISTRAGSLGINLVAANRVIIFDVSWNPSHDTQSIFRVYRFGQNKPCYIYRFIAMGTMEQKVYERQVTKQATAKRVIDEQQIERHYNQNDLLELYSYELTPKNPRETPIFPKDRLFAEILTTYDKLVYKYHEHDSLLENQVEDNLSEEDRKAAWDEYEIEKTNPPMPTYTNNPIFYNRQNYTFGTQAIQGPVTSNKIFGFRTDVLLRLLNMKVGRDFPSLNPTQVVEKVPVYLQQLYTEMNAGNPAMYRELLDLHQELEMPQGYYMNPLLYANQNPVSGGVTPAKPEQENNGGTTRTLVRNPYANRPPPTINPEIFEID